jgi:predicted Zn-ribbon and HTH transcriptional regulator
MFRIALDRLVAKRAEYQAEMKKETPGTPAHTRAKRLQGAFKIVANSFYGITGSPWSRFFDPEIAEGVTQTGRWLLESVIAEAKARELDPFCGDTDSVFIGGGVGSMKSLVAHMNQTWADRLAPWGITDGHHIDLDFEKTFKRLILISAKRYAGSFLTYKGKAAAPDAKPEVKGLEFKRGDTIRLARDMQTEIVKMLLEPDLPDPADLMDVVERWRSHVLDGDLELADLVVTQSLSKKVEDYVTRYAADRCIQPKCGYSFGSTDKHGPKKCPQCGSPRAATGVPAHVRVAKLLAERGTPLGEGDRVSYVVVGSDDGIEAIPSADVDAFDRADRVYYWERRIYPATGRVLEKVYPGSHWGESKGQRKDRAKETAGQTRLDFGAPRTIRRRKKTTDPRRIATMPQPRRRKVKSGSPGKIQSEGTPKVRRRRKKKPAGIVVTLRECSAAEDGGAEAYRRKRILEAIRAAIEAHPGDHPVEILITWREVAKPDTYHVKVTIPTGLSMAKTTAARVALERVAVPGMVSGF